MNRILIFLLLFYCCSPNKEKDRVGRTENIPDTAVSKIKSNYDLEKIIGQNFITIVDTYAYAFRSIFINHPAKPLPTGDSSLVILIDTLIHGEDGHDLRAGSLKRFKKNDRYHKFLKLLEGSPISENTLTPDSIRNTGRYKLRALGTEPRPTDIVVGGLTFYTPYIGKNSAILYVLKYTSVKSGIVTIYLFERDSTRWKIVEKNDIVFF